MNTTPLQPTRRLRSKRALGIEVQHEHPLAEIGLGRVQVDGQGGFADAQPFWLQTTMV